MYIKFAKLDDRAKIPSKRKEDAGLDIYMIMDEDYIILKPHQTVKLKTGLASVIENGYYVQLFERGSTGTKGIIGHSGVIDSGYRGEWIVPLANGNNYPLMIVKEEWLVSLPSDVIESFEKNYILYPYEKAVCQAVVLPVPNCDVEEICLNDLNNFKSEREDGKLGSSGK